MTSWFWDLWDQAADWWTGLGARVKTGIAAGLAWVLVPVVALAPLAPLLPEASTPARFDLPSTPFEPALLSAPTTTSNLRFEDGRMVLSARGPSGDWVQVLQAPPERLPGQFAKLTATSPDRRHVVYVTAADQTLNDAVIHLAEASTGRVRDLAAIPSGLFPTTPVWSPDASRVAILRRAADGGGLELWTIHVATGEQVRVPTPEPVPPEAFYGADETPLVWSADGERLAYVAPHPSDGTLVRDEVAVADGRTERTTVGVLPPKPACEVPVFSQNDPRWSDLRMRDLGDTIGAAGCALTAAAMVLNYYGAELDPADLNECLGPAAQPLYWGAATAPDCAGAHADLENFVAFSWDTLSGLMAQGRPAILGFAGGPTGSHYVVVTAGSGSDGANYAILDPWDGTTWKTVDYYALKGYSPERLVVFRGDETICTSRTERRANLTTEPLLDGAPTGVDGTLKWRPLIEQVAREEDADPDVIQAVMAISSGGNSLAIGPDSPPNGNAMGLMQVMSGIDWHWDPVADRLGRRPTRDEMLDPEHNIRAGAYELATRHKLGGNWSDWLICAVAFFNGTTEDGRIAGTRDAGGTAGWTYYDRIRANVTWLRDYYGRGGPIPPPPDEVSRPPGWPGVGTLAMIVGGPVTISQGFGYTGFTPSPGAYDYSVTLGLNAGDHAAVDISLLRGAPLYAAMDAVVVTSGGTPFFRDDINPAAGELRFRMANGVEIIYGHTAEITVPLGTTVGAGQQVALTGQAGTGSHLHLEVRVPDPTTQSGMRAVDPQVFFSGEDGFGGFAGSRANWPTAEAIDARIAMSEQQNGTVSHLHGMGSIFLDMGARYGVNPGFVVAMLQKESQLGADGSLLPTQANNFGGITGSGNCGQQWIDFDRWADRYFAKYCSHLDGIEANFEIFTQPQYRRTNGTIAAVLEVYSPSYENDNRAAMASIQAVGRQLRIELSASTNVYGGSPGSGFPPTSPGSPPTIPPEWNSTGPPVAPASPPDVRIAGIEDLTSYNRPVTVGKVELIFPVDPDAPVELSVPIGTRFDREGRYAIDLAVLSPHLPGGVARSTVTFTIDYTPPTTRIEVLGVPVDEPPADGTPPSAAVGPPRDRAGEGVERDAPVIGAAPIETATPAATTYRNEAIISLSAEDALSQIRAILYRFDGEAWLYYTTSGPPRPVSLRLPGCHTVDYLAIDAAGNKESPNSVAVCVETTETAPADLTATAAAETPATVRATERPTEPGTPPGTPQADTPVVARDAGSPTATVTAVIIAPATATPTPVPSTGTPDPATPDPATLEVATPATATPADTPSPGTPPADATEPATETATVVETTVDAGDGATPDDGSPVPSATVAATDSSPAPDAATPGATSTPTSPPTEVGTPAADLTATASTEEPVTATETPTVTSPSTPVLPTGDLEIVFEDQRSRAIPGACVAITAFDGSLHTFCDADDGDADGTTLAHDVPTGSAEVEMATVPPGFIAPDSRQVTIGQEPRTRIVGRRDAGSLRITTVDEAGQPVAGSCFQVVGADGQARGPLCDDLEGDGDPAPGAILFPDLAAGDASLRQTRAADGYVVLAENPTVSIPSGETGAIEIVNVRRVGSLRLISVDHTGQPLAGACYALLRPDGQTTASVCDDDDRDRQPEVGFILIEDLPVGPLSVRQIVPPAGFPLVFDQPAIVEEGATKDVTISHAVRFELTIRRLDAGGTPLTDSCFEVFTLVEGVERALAGSICDEDDGALDGEATLPDLIGGDYLVKETRSPPGFPAADSVAVGVGADLPNLAEVRGSREVGTLTIRRTDVDGVTDLPGACFDVYTAAFGAALDYVDSRCDADDGALDGRTIFENLTIGDYVVQEWQAPAGGFELAAPAIAGVVAGPGEEFLVVGGRLTGSLTIVRTDEAGAPQPGSCFDVYTYVDGEAVDHATGPCDEDDGLVDGRTDALDLRPGEYLVVETQRSSGSAPSEARVAIVEAGQANQVVIAAVPVSPTETPTPEPLPTVEDDRPTEPAPTETGVPTPTTTEPAATEPAATEPAATETPASGSPAAVPPSASPVTTAEPIDDAGVTRPGGDVPPFELTIRRADEAGEELPGSCFGIYAVDGSSRVSTTARCDGDDGTADGVTEFPPFPAGDYEIIEISAPYGFTEPVAAIELRWPSDPPEVLIENGESATLTIVRYDPAGNPVTGACFEILSATAEDDVGGLVAKACDGDDETQDGTTVVRLALGDYFVAETIPSQAEPVPATVAEDEPNQLVVEGPAAAPDQLPSTEPTATLPADVPTDTPALPTDTPIPPLDTPVPPPTDTPVPPPTDTPAPPPTDTPVPELIG